MFNPLRRKETLGLVWPLLVSATQGYPQGLYPDIFMWQYLWDWNLITTGPSFDLMLDTGIYTGTGPNLWLIIDTSWQVT